MAIRQGEDGVCVTLAEPLEENVIAGPTAAKWWS